LREDFQTKNKKWIAASIPRIHPLYYKDHQYLRAFKHNTSANKRTIGVQRNTCNPLQLTYGFYFSTDLVQFRYLPSVNFIFRIIPWILTQRVRLCLCVNACAGACRSMCVSIYKNIHSYYFSSISRDIFNIKGTTLGGNLWIHVRHKIPSCGARLSSVCWGSGWTTELCSALGNSIEMLQLWNSSTADEGVSQW
jgi:hypothetical protein